MKQAGSTRLCVLVFKMILVLKELCTFHIGVKSINSLALSFSHVQFFATSMDYRPLGSSVPGILQTKILEWVTMTSSRGSSRPRF